MDTTIAELDAKIAAAVKNWMPAKNETIRITHNPVHDESNYIPGRCSVCGSEQYRSPSVPSNYYNDSSMWPEWRHACYCLVCYPELNLTVQQYVEMVLAARQIAKIAAEQEQIQENLRSQVGRKLITCGFGNYKPATDSQRAAMKIVEGNGWWDPSPFLVLTGRSGTGKTHLAAASFRTFFPTNPSSLFVVETEVFAEWRQAARDRTSFDTFDRMMSTPLLFLDDLGTTNHTDGSREHLFEIIDYRSRHQKATMFTTNFALAQLEERLGEKIVSRIVEVGMSRVVVVDGPNYRIRAA